MNELHIGTRTIGPSHPPLVVAELSGNHNQSLDRALALVDAAADAGAEAIKLQTYTPDTMTIDVREREFLITSPTSPWRGQSLYELYQQAHTPWEWHEPLFRRCRQLGMWCFSTPFDETAVDFLEKMDVPTFKIASFENTDLPLLRRVAATGKPVLISTGMASVAELDETVRQVRSSGCDELMLLKCTSAYPSPPTAIQLRTIPHMSALFDVQVGLSDHSLGNGPAIAAVALGATLIEKHFTLSREDGGVDAAFSVEPDELHKLIADTRSAWEALGTVSYGVLPDEEGSQLFRRSLYVVENMKKGDVFSAENVARIRPGFGLSAAHLDIVLGRRAAVDIDRGTALQWSLIA